MAPNDVQDVWAQALGSRYQRTRVVLFRDAIESFKRGMVSGDLQACDASPRSTR